MNWIHYPWDFLVIAIVALIFYQLGTTSYFESIYFKRANKLNKKMGDKLRNAVEKQDIKIGKKETAKNKTTKSHDLTLEINVSSVLMLLFKIRSLRR